MMTAASDIAFGYNHDIPHRGRVYHVQTEHSVRDKHRICTHVFHAGTIVASSQVDYDVERMANILELLRASHKSMALKLIHGALDEAIASSLGQPWEHEGVLIAQHTRPPGAAATTHQAPRAPSTPTIPQELDVEDIKQTLEDIQSKLAGTLGVALVDYESGMCIATSDATIDMEVAAAGKMEVMKAQIQVMGELGVNEGIEDIIITLGSQYHIIRPVDSTLFLYLAIDRKQGNLALARRRLRAASTNIHDV